MAKTGKDAEKVSPEGLTSLGDVAALGLAAAKTPCEVMGENEILPILIRVKRTDEVWWQVSLCNTPARALLSISDMMGHQKDLANQIMPPPNPLRVEVMSPELSPPPGRYTLIWTLFPSGPDWQMVVEVAVNDAVLFRHFKSAKSTLPIPRGFLVLEVV